MYLARLVRNQVRSIRQEPYLEAVRAAGTGLLKVIVSLTFGVPAAIFIEAFLSFVGVGVPPPPPAGAP